MGNVDTLLQDYRFGVIGANGNRFKKIVYEFDLVSGKVNQVSYQPGQPDAFYHRYFYDAENRITHVQTSADSINWDNDAFYSYYDHGPLARTVLGEQQVQGINYAYSLHGWIKGINPDVYNGGGYTLKPDGSTGSVVGKPAYNVLLNYYRGDYWAISGAAPMDNGLNTVLGADSSALFNGNISSMCVNITKLNNPMLYNYQYDQLNRLVKMDAWHKTGSAWNNVVILPDFQERISYDANGNILKYKRNGNNSFAGKPLGMDSLSYSYAMGTNRLDHVRDSVAAGNYTEDIDSQLAGNYKYDSIGNMVSDDAEGIMGIEWTVYGKIRHIEKINGNNIYYTYDASANRISKTVVAGVDKVTTWYVRDAQGNTISVYRTGIDSVNDGRLSQIELHLYGNNRLGMLLTSIDVASEPVINDTAVPVLGKGHAISFIRGRRLFELSNHLDNVLVTVNDKRVGVTSNDSTVDYYMADVKSSQDYYPFGMVMIGRKFNVGGYRYGFNGKENDNEVKGEGDQQDYGMRIYDTRIGRFLSVDPLTKNYPWYTPYQFAGNKPINSIDLDGLEEYDSYAAYQKAKGKSALKKMDGSDGAWLTSDRKDKTSVWSNAMETITKKKWTDRFKSFAYVPAGPYSMTDGIRENDYSFGIIRDYYNWAQHEMDEKGFGSQWAKGASYLSDELADTYEEGAKSGHFTSMGGLLKGLSQAIAGYAVGKFSSVLYDGEKVPSSKDGWYVWDANFVMEEQVTKVAPSVYKSYAGTKALKQLNNLVRKEKLLGGAASFMSRHFFPNFSNFGVSVNSPSSQFGADGRYNIPLLMLYPYTHQAKRGIKLTSEQFNEIWKAHNAINSYYRNSMKY